MRASDPTGITRREMIAAGAVAGAGLTLGARPSRAAGDRVIHSVDFASLRDRAEWPDGWVCNGVANLRVSGGVGVLEAGSDVYPYDPRPYVFAVDARVLAGSISAVIEAVGSLAGVILRRVSPRDYYAAFYDSQAQMLSIVRRSGFDLATLTSLPVSAANTGLTLELAATGASPTTLVATLAVAGAAPLSLTATDDYAPLQQPGDGGVLGQSKTLFPSAGPSADPALGNVHLLPFGTAQGQQFLGTPAGQAIIGEIRRESTVTFRRITIRSAEMPQLTPASVIAATSMLPLLGGGRLRVASDLPADVAIEIAESPDFTASHRLSSRVTGDFEGYMIDVAGLTPRKRAYWRATLRRRGTTAIGPVRSFPMLPAPGDGAPVRMAIASCAAQFISLFDDLVALQPDVFVWMGDLNYPDTAGPLAQTMTGYAGIWRDFLANPTLAPLLQRSAFVPMRDDHDYGANDCNSTVIPKFPWAIAPWDALMGKEIGVRFSAGLADVWVLDQRRFKSDPNLPNTPAKTLLGTRQREWLLETLRASRAPFKVICSPCTVFMSANPTDGNWSDGFTAERDEIVKFIDRHVSGRTIFIAGDFHLTGVYDKDGHYEARPCPLGIPVPNDITLDDPMYAQKLAQRPGVTYADDRCHFGVVEVHGRGDTAVLEVSLRREDHTTPYTKTFIQPIPPAVVKVTLDGVDQRGVHADVTLDRPGVVNVSATVNPRGGRGVTRIGAEAVRFDRPATHRVTIPAAPAARRVLGVHGRLRLNLIARYRSPGGRVTVRRVQRTLSR